MTQTVMPGESASQTAPFMSTVADAILAMDYSPLGYDLDRTMRVIKMRGSGHDSHPYRLTIGTGGLTVEKMTAQEYAQTQEYAADHRTRRAIVSS